MVNFFDRLQKLYNKEIRECCDEKKNLMLYCLKENRENEFICDNEIKSFNKCIQDYSNNFIKKYSRVANFKIYY